MFTAEGDLVTCSGLDKDETQITSAFRTQFGTATSKDAPLELPSDAKMLFRVTVEEVGASKTKKAPVLFVGVPHSAPFADVLALFNRQFASSNERGGAFLLEGGFGVNPNQNAGQVFMKCGQALTFHTKVELSRVAWR